MKYTDYINCNHISFLFFIKYPPPNCKQKLPRASAFPTPLEAEDRPLKDHQAAPGHCFGFYIDLQDNSCTLNSAIGRKESFLF